MIRVTWWVQLPHCPMPFKNEQEARDCAARNRARVECVRFREVNGQIEVVKGTP